MSFPEEIEAVKESALKELGVLTDTTTLRAYETKYLGRQGVVRNLTGRIPQLNAEEKGTAGRLINELKNLLTQKLTERQAELSAQPTVASDDTFDATLPGEVKQLGHRHPVYTTLEEICRIFVRLGFEIAYGPEIETEYHNFSALNIPLEHPSRDAFDTFYLNLRTEKPKNERTGKEAKSSSVSPSFSSSVSAQGGSASGGEEGRWLLRSHTSPVQIRVMKNRQPPIQVIMPGKVFRPDKTDQSHFPMFHQVEGLMVGEGISLAHLKGILDLFCKEFFGPATQMRFRPSFFPFTEPSAEVDISCHICGGKGELADSTTCGVCRGAGWIEVLGSGVVHPQVLENVGYDSERYTGFAFGMGVERLAMLKYRINDIRLFTENHIAFLTQF